MSGRGQAASDMLGDSKLEIDDMNQRRTRSLTENWQGKCHGGNDWEVEVKSGCKESAKRGQAKDEVTLSKG